MGASVVCHCDTDSHLGFNSQGAENLRVLEVCRQHHADAHLQWTRMTRYLFLKARPT